MLCACVAGRRVFFSIDDDSVGHTIHIHALQWSHDSDVQLQQWRSVNDTLLDYSSSAGVDAVWYEPASDALYVMASYGSTRYALQRFDVSSPNYTHTRASAAFSDVKSAFMPSQAFGKPLSSRTSCGGCCSLVAALVSQLSSLRLVILFACCAALLAAQCYPAVSETVEAGGPSSSTGVEWSSSTATATPTADTGSSSSTAVVSTFTGTASPSADSSSSSGDVYTDSSSSSTSSSSTADLSTADTSVPADFSSTASAASSAGVQISMVVQANYTLLKHHEAQFCSELLQLLTSAEAIALSQQRVTQFEITEGTSYSHATSTHERASATLHGAADCHIQFVITAASAQQPHDPPATALATRLQLCLLDNSCALLQWQPSFMQLSVPVQSIGMTAVLACPQYDRSTDTVTELYAATCVPTALQPQSETAWQRYGLYIVVAAAALTVGLLTAIVCYYYRKKRKQQR